MEKPEERVDVLKKQATDAVSRGDFELAAIKYGQALEVDPADATLYSNRSSVLLKLGRTDAALSDAEKTISLKPDWSRGYLRKGLVLSHLQQFADAIVWFEKGLKLEPGESALQKALLTAQAKRDGVGSSFTYVAGHGLFSQLGPNQMVDVPAGGQSILSRYKYFEGKSVAAIVGGKYHFLCLLSDGSVYAWGWNSRGQLGMEGGTMHEPRLVRALAGKKVVQAAAGVYHSLVLTSEGEVYMMGLCQQEPPGTPSHVPTRIAAFAGLPAKVVQIAAGYYHCMALLDNGSVFHWGDVGVKCYKVPTLVSELNGETVRYISAGSHGSAAVLSNGSLWTWGNNSRLVLGHPKDCLMPPTVVEAFKNVPVWRIAIGRHISAAVSRKGSLYVWGSNRCYPHRHAYASTSKLVAGATEFPASPTLVPGPARRLEVDQIAVGKAFVAVLDARGDCWSYGHNGWGQLAHGHRTVAAYDRAFEGWSPIEVPLKFNLLAAGHYNLYLCAVARVGGLAQALGRCFESEDFADVKFVAGGQQIACHRALLWARCPAFFEKVVAKSTASPIALEGDPRVLREFFKYLYADPVSVDAELKERLAQVARTFDVPRLVAMASGEPVPISTLNKDLARLLSSSFASDVTFVVEGKKTAGHKWLLTARCDYFRMMFLGPMKESKETEVPIPDMTAEVFSAVLEYIYTDKAGLKPHTAVDVMLAANLFGLEELKYACEQEISENLDEENVLLLWQLGETYNCPYLSRRCMRFIEVNMPNVRGSKDYQELPALLKERFGALNIS